MSLLIGKNKHFDRELIILIGKILFDREMSRLIGKMMFLIGKKKIDRKKYF
jgi:hypothetical protein